MKQLLQPCQNLRKRNVAGNTVSTSSLPGGGFCKNMGLDMCPIFNNNG